MSTNPRQAPNGVESCSEPTRVTQLAFIGKVPELRDSTKPAHVLQHLVASGHFEYGCSIPIHTYIHTNLQIAARATRVCITQIIHLIPRSAWAWIALKSSKPN